mmetsp:Transcript_14591/g.46844  ORF Transcript_14591/g.46844 Transcript_14591/m.46844 type:complete len:480 (+) Transcript_14591:37-1476(+)
MEQSSFDAVEAAVEARLEEARRVHAQASQDSQSSSWDVVDSLGSLSISSSNASETEEQDLVQAVPPTHANLQAQAQAAPVETVRRQFVCPEHGAYWKKVSASGNKRNGEFVARCKKCPVVGGVGLKYVAIPVEEERGKGLFECGECGNVWTSNTACRSLAQYCWAEGCTASDRMQGAYPKEVRAPDPGWLRRFRARREPPIDENVPFDEGFGGGGGLGGSLPRRPLFLYLPYQAVHWPLEAPPQYVDRYRGRTGGDTRRQLVCAMAKALDDGVGQVTAALKRRGMWDDSLVLFSSGRVELPAPTAERDEALAEFEAALKRVCDQLAADVARNGEGTTHVLRVAVRGAPSAELARGVGKAVVNSPLVKTAVAGNDPNVGRIVGAVGSFLGRAAPQLDLGQCTMAIGGDTVFEGGSFRLSPTREASLSAHLRQAQQESAPFPPHERFVEVEIDLGAGGEASTVIGSDLTREYVDINADYRS